MPFTFIAHTSLPLAYSRMCQTPWSVFLDGSVAPIQSAGPSPAAIQTARRSPTERLMPPAKARLTRDAEVHCPQGKLSRRREAGRKRVSSCQFQALFNSLFKVLCIFPSRYLFAIGLSPVFSFRWNLPPALGCIPKQPDSSTAPRGENELKPTGLSPSLASHSKELGLRPPQRALL